MNDSTLCDNCGGEDIKLYIVEHPIQFIRYPAIDQDNWDEMDLCTSCADKLRSRGYSVEEVEE